MNVATIKSVDIANGAGVRVSLFVSGCTHHCPGCFNAEAWDFGYGEPYTAETEQQLIELLRPAYIRGLSLLGGEPFEPQNQRVLVTLLRRIRAELPEKDVWCYSGYTLDNELLQPSRARCEVTDEMLSMIDVLVDGRFEQDKRNLMLRFRGSENQRVIDLPATLASGTIVEWKGL